jgi:O-antigen/teichoic acid export membrane protein
MNKLLMWRTALRNAAGSRLGGNILALYAVQTLNYVLPLIVLPYLLRILGPHGFGSIAFAQALMGYAVILTDFGFNLSATRAISLVRDSPAEIARVFWSTMAAKLLLLALSVAVIAPVVAFVPALRQQWSVFAICSLMVAGAIAFPQWYFQGLERMRTVAIVHVLTRFVSLIATFVFVHSAHDQLAAAAILSMPTLLAAGFCIVAIRYVAPVRFYRPSGRDIRAAFASSWHLFLSSAAVLLYLNTNAFLLGLLSGTYAVALFTLANKVAMAAFNFLGPVMQAVFPRASILLRRPSAEGRAFIIRLAWMLLPIAAALSLALLLFAPAIVAVVGGAKFADAVPVLRVMALLPFLLTCATILAQIVMVNTGLSKSLSTVYLIAGGLNLGILPILILHYQAIGAALSLVIVELLGPILMMHKIRRSRVLAPADRPRA